MNQESRELEERLSMGMTPSRMESFADGVFAFAATLLVLNLTFPVDLPNENLVNLFLKLWPQFLTYFMSFMVLATLWVGKQNLLHLIKHLDRKSVWITIICLSFIVLIPFSTSLLRTYYQSTIAIVAYGTNLTVCGVSLWWLWAHAVRRRLIKDDVTPMMVSMMSYRILVPVFFGVLITLFAFVSPVASLFMLALLFLLTTIPTNSDSVIGFLARALHRRFG